MILAQIPVTQPRSDDTKYVAVHPDRVEYVANWVSSQGRIVGTVIRLTSGNEVFSQFEYSEICGILNEAMNDRYGH